MPEYKKTTAECNRCGKERTVRTRADGEAKVPFGWHEHAGKLWCAECWSSEFVARTIVVPIAGPAEGGSWTELRAALKECWSASTRAANWAITDLYVNDVRRNPSDGPKMPGLNPRYQYPEARAVVPGMDSHSLVQLLHWARRQYAHQRYNVIWRGDASLRNERYPVPYPIHNQSWRLVKSDDGALVVSLRLGGKRWLLRLRAGGRYRRQGEALNKVLQGSAKRGTISIYRQRANPSDHRPEMPQRRNGGGTSVSYRVMVGINLHLPKHEPPKAQGVLHVRTSATDERSSKALLAYGVDRGEWRYWYADHARRLCCALRRRQRALSNDTKAEKRRTKRNSAGIRDAQRRLSTTYRRALSAVTHEGSATIANYAARKHVKRVVFDDVDRSFDFQFPWHELATKLTYKLAERRIVLDVVSKREEKTPEPDDSE